MNLGLLALLAIVVLLLLMVRERFEATPTIKDPSNWDEAEITRIKNMVSPPSTLTESEIRDIVGGFWTYSIPDRAGNPQNQQLKGWKNETLQITMNDIAEYLDLKSVSTDKRNQFRDLLKAYYVDQGQSVFQQARQGADASTTDKATTGSVAPLERPLTTDPKLRREVASYTGIPVNDPKLDNYIQKIQDFYDNVYLPDKKAPTQTQIASFVKDIPESEIPDNTKRGLEAVIDHWFTQSQTASQLLEGVPQPRSEPATTTGAVSTELGVPRYKQGPIGEGPGGFSGNAPKTTQNIFGPLYSGVGESSSAEGGGDSSKVNRYPEILGGFGATSSGGAAAGGGVAAGGGLSGMGFGPKSFDLPSMGSLGLNDNSQFFPFSRTPGDQDGAYMNRIGNTGLSTVPKSKTDPVPFLSDFSAFFR
jgi:hypothetical protein